MSKSFKEVFLTLDLPEDLSGVMEDVFVTKVATNKQNTRLKIYLSSSHIIEKKQLNRIAKQITKQLFKDKEITVLFDERYKLSSQYTVPAITNMYMDSIIEECKDGNRILYELLKNADVETTDDTLKVILPDSVIAKKNTIP